MKRWRRTLRRCKDRHYRTSDGRFELKPYITSGYGRWMFRDHETGKFFRTRTVWDAQAEIRDILNEEEASS